jgi:DNA polymerase-1
MAVSIPFGHPNGNTLIRAATRRKDKTTNKFVPVPAVFSDPPKQLRRSRVFEILRPLFLHPDIIKIAHNATFDLVSTAKYLGEVPRGPLHDTIVMQHLLNENLISKRLKDLIARYWKVKYDFDNVGKCIEAHTFRKVAHYAFMDVRYTWLLWKRLRPLIDEDNLREVFELELNNGMAGVIDVLCEMNRTGAPVDVDALEVLREELSKRLVDIEADIYRAAGEKFNINSVPQKQRILFGKKSDGGQGLKPIKETDSGAPSTDAETLEHYADKNALCKSLLDYAEINKLLGTYVLGYLGEEGNPKKPCRIYDGRIHADLVQYGTVTGRFSCREPNLQNIPRPDTDLGKKIRGLFIAPPGYKMVVADYGQIEMMLLAHFAGPGPLYHGIHNGMDPHSATAAALAGIDPAEFMDMVRDEDKKAKAARQVAKGVNFAVVYGAGPDKVASMADISVSQAKNFLGIHQDEFPEVYRFKNRVIEVCKSRRPPHVVTLLGRKRRLPTIFSSDRGIRGQAERQAVNSLIQGSAADVIKLAMIRLHNTLPDDMKLILSVHDELVTLTPEDRADECAELVHEAMLGEGIQSLVNVPLDSDLKIVDRWAEAK